MAAGVRSDRRIARIRETCLTTAWTAAPGAEHGLRCRMLQAQGRKSGCVDLYLSQLAKTDIGRADRQGPGAASSLPGHEHGDQGPRA
jgi:hypothetical protein